jgi:hypothetical protein
VEPKTARFTSRGVHASRFHGFDGRLERNVVPMIPLRKNQGHREASIPAQERCVAQALPSPPRCRVRVRALKHDYGLASFAFAALSGFGSMPTL